MKFIIEHCDDKVWKWSFLEYKQCSKYIGKDNFIITNVKRISDIKKLSKFCKAEKQSITEMNLPKEKIIILDPNAEKELSFSDSKYGYFIFGGILGDYPMRKRTRKLISSKMKGCKLRNLGKYQLSTDNAVYVANEILKGKKLSDMKFVKPLVIKTGENEELIMNFAYPIVNGKPLISNELVKFIKNDKGF